MTSSCESEFGDSNLPDRRLKDRLRKIADRMLATPMQSIASACADWAEVMGAYRFLNHASVNEEKILSAHREATLARSRECDCIGVIQDTSELDFTPKKCLEGTGALNVKTRQGFFAHPQFVVSEEGVPLGVIKSGLYAREEKTGEGKSRHRPIEEKESFRWLEGYREACTIQEELPGVTVVSIADREGDIYEVYDEWLQRRQEKKPTADWLIRATRDRALLEQEGESTKRSLFETAAEAPELGVTEFTIRKRVQKKKVKGSTKTVHRQGRDVRQRVRAIKLHPRPPYRRGRKLREVSFWVVYAEEIDPPEGGEPLCWVLLTSLPVETFEQAKRIIALYLGRWQIEVFFRVLKTGCRIEEVQLKKKQAVFNVLTLYMIVAWRILYLVHMGRQCPDLPCSVIFDEIEWKAAVAVSRFRQGKGKCRSADALEEPSLGEMVRIIARFGGHLGRNNDPPPGAQALWQGMICLVNYAQAWDTFGPSQK